MVPAHGPRSVTLSLISIGCLYSEIPWIVLPGVKVFRLAYPQGEVLWWEMAGTLVKMAGNSSENDQSALI